MNLAQYSYDFGAPTTYRKKISLLMSRFRVTIFTAQLFLVRIFAHSECGKIRTRRTTNTDTFYTVLMTFPNKANKGNKFYLFKGVRRKWCVLW